MNRDELREVGATALISAQLGMPAHPTDRDRKITTVILDAVEPIIRADERQRAIAEIQEKHRYEDEVTIYARAWDEVSNEVMAKVEAYERLRAKWKALDATRDDGIFLRSEIDALLDGGGE